MKFKTTSTFKNADISNLSKNNDAFNIWNVAQNTRNPDLGVKLNILDNKIENQLNNIQNKFLLKIYSNKLINKNIWKLNTGTYKLNKNNSDMIILLKDVVNYYPIFIKLISKKLKCSGRITEIQFFGSDDINNNDIKKNYIIIEFESKFILKNNLTINNFSLELNGTFLTNPKLFYYGECYFDKFNPCTFHKYITQNSFKINKRKYYCRPFDKTMGKPNMYCASIN